MVRFASRCLLLHQDAPVKHLVTTYCLLTSVGAFATFFWPWPIGFVKSASAPRAIVTKAKRLIFIVMVIASLFVLFF